MEPCFPRRRAPAHKEFFMHNIKYRSTQKRVSSRQKSLFLCLVALLLFVTGCGSSPSEAVSESVSYTITVLPSDHGSISPSGEITLPSGDSQAFTVTPSEGYLLADVMLDGESLGAVSTFTIENVTAHHTLSATFVADELLMIEFDKKVDMTYVFTGDEKEKAGFAQGVITVSPGNSAKTDGYYLVYFANGEGVLSDYDEVASIAITGGTVSYNVKDGTYLPPQATLLAVFESDSRCLSQQPSIETAVDVIRIDPAKRLSLGGSQFRFGATSDVHMNFEALGFGSLQKWENALAFYAAHQVDCLVVTGDMTGDTDLATEYEAYISRIEASDIPLDAVYEGIGNHGNTPASVDLFTKYTGGSDQVHPFEGSPYFYVYKKSNSEGVRNNLFIFMAQELKGPSDSAAYDNFSKRQIDWLEETLEAYDTPETNVFLIEHSPILHWSPGDRQNGDYTRMITFKESFTQTMRLKALLEKHRRVIMMTGHTHLTFYENENYSDQYNSFCRMIHVSSGTQTSSYNHGDTMISDTDGRQYNSPSYGSEGYVVDVYDDFIVYTGYNISTGKIIPAACLLLPVEPYGGSGSQVMDPTIKDITEKKDLFDVVKGTGTAKDPYLIETEEAFKLLTEAFAGSTATEQTEMFGYGMYFLQTADLDMSNVEGYNGISAGGSTRYTFAGHYDGNGHTLRVEIADGGQRSVFPYTYGVISNLRVEGSIQGGTCAQVVRALHGKLINCIFDVDLKAEQEAGAIYSNYGYVYNLYVTGTHSSGGAASPVATNHNSTDYHNVFHYRIQNSAAVSSPHGIQSRDLPSIVEVFNDKTHPQYETASDAIGFREVLQVEVVDRQLVFKIPEE